MNEQAFTNALRAIRGDRRDYPEHKAPDPVKVALEALDDFYHTLMEQGFILTLAQEAEGKLCNELQARIEMRVQELRELITTGEITP